MKKYLFNIIMLIVSLALMYPIHNFNSKDLWDMGIGAFLTAFNIFEIVNIYKKSKLNEEN